MRVMGAALHSASAVKAPWQPSTTSSDWLDNCLPLVDVFAGPLSNTSWSPVHVHCTLSGGCAQVPWEPRSTSPKVGWTDAWFLGLFDRFARAALKQGHLRLILPNG